MRWAVEDVSFPLVCVRVFACACVQYILFEHPEDHPKVRVRFSSMDSTRNVCAIASVQKTYVSQLKTKDCV